MFEISCYLSAVCVLRLLLQLKPSAWADYGSGNMFVLRRNVTIHSTYEPLGLMDFQLMERQVLLDAGVTLTFHDIVLQNVRFVCSASAMNLLNSSSCSRTDEHERVMLVCRLAGC